MGSRGAIRGDQRCLPEEHVDPSDSIRGITREMADEEFPRLIHSRIAARSRF